MARSTRKAKAAEIHPDTKLNINTPFSVTEAYKMARANLLFSLAVHGRKAVVISSALSEEGKTTTCANLALSMAQTGARVLLMDADLRKPMQHKLFGLSNKKGLSNLLVGFDGFTDILQTKVECGLDIITSGRLPPNPSELVGSPNMKILLDKLADRYDYVFVDSPPINVVSDAIVLSSLASGLLMVARQGRCTYDDLEKAIDSVRFANANILGVLINGVKDRKLHKDNHYSYYVETEE